MEFRADNPCDRLGPVLTAQFDEAIYVLHAFEKKSKSGITTPKSEIDLIRRRLTEAERLHRERQR